MAKHRSTKANGRTNNSTAGVVTLTDRELQLITRLLNEKKEPKPAPATLRVRVPSSDARPERMKESSLSLYAGLVEARRRTLCAELDNEETWLNYADREWRLERIAEYCRLEAELSRAFFVSGRTPSLRPLQMVHRNRNVSVRTVNRRHGERANVPQEETESLTS